MSGSSGAVLILGGARSGKSGFAEKLAAESGLDPVYVATGQPRDAEMAERIRHHRERRGDGWTTIEEPVDLVGVLKREATAKRVLMVDCMTLWVTNLMLDSRDVGAEGKALTTGLAGLPGLILLVSNEVGLGIVPENRMARDFRDHAGRLHQDIAQAADAVYFIAAGLPMKLKG